MITAAQGLPDAEGERVDCSVLVPVLDEERYIEKTLAAIRGQRFGGRLEFIFADGGSTDRTREILEAHAQADPRVQVRENPRRSVSSGLNVALRHARGRWTARMDAHTEYQEDYLALGVERLKRGGTRWVSGPPVPQGHGPVSRSVALALGTRLGRGGSRKWAQADCSHEAEYELDAGLFGGVWERQTLLDYGGWDERWASNEDSEMAGRFLERDEHLVCLPAMAARYVPRDSLARLWRQYLVYGEYRVRTANRHPSTVRPAHVMAPALVLDAGVAICSPAVFRRPARFGLGVYAGVLALEGLRSVTRADTPYEALLVPVSLLTMHVAWGAGTLRGAARYGVPLAALARVAGLKRLPGADAPKSQAVFAPSLTS